MVFRVRSEIDLPLLAAFVIGSEGEEIPSAGPCEVDALRIDHGCAARKAIEAMLSVRLEFVIKPPLQLASGEVIAQQSPSSGFGLGGHENPLTPCDR